MIRTTIYYFSATGNSFTTARSIAANLGETELVSIPQLPMQAVKTHAPRVGLVFPVHMWGVPALVARLIARLEVPQDAYIFAVATSGGMPCGTLKQTQRLLAERGLKLSAGFSLTIVNNCTTVMGAPPLQKQQVKIQKAKRTLERICAAVREGKRHLYKGIPIVNWLFYKYMYQRALPKVPSMGKAYFTDTNCNG
jgi:hypothetical protein